MGGKRARAIGAESPWYVMRWMSGSWMSCSLDCCGRVAGRAAHLNTEETPARTLVLETRKVNKLGVAPTDQSVLYVAIALAFDTRALQAVWSGRYREIERR